MTLFESMERDEAVAADVDAVDMFAGPGGWSVALDALGMTDVGLEHDRWACATRRAAGFATVQVDVSHADPADYRHVRGVIASPPCQALSNAGNREGLKYVDELAAAIDRADWQFRPARDPRIWLALEIGRWVDVIRPNWVALEQVPAALPLWHAYARWLATLGYHTWVGILNAADYGVPQIRRRAVLMASLDHELDTPPPTHAKTAGAGLERWITMAEGLGYGMTDRPSTTLAPGKDSSGLGGSGARATVDREIAAGRWRVGFPRLDDGRGAEPPEDGYRARDWRDADEPSFAVTEKARSWMIDTRRHWGQHPDGGNQRFDAAAVPAAAVTSKTGGQWVLNPGRTETQQNRRLYELDEPAPTLAFGHDVNSWMFERPATTIAGDPRAFAPGSHMANDGRDNSKAIGRSENTILLTIEHALLLQSFPADYPVRGRRAKQFEQVGNAIPPRLAYHVLRAVVGTSPLTG